MKRAIVPAQVTTVEDTVAGNLSLTQLGLLSAPIFAGCLIYLVLPPVMGAAGYKLALVLLGFGVGAGLAIRFKGRLLGSWLLMIARYNRRPRYYVLDKNDGYLRDLQPGAAPAPVARATVLTEHPAATLAVLSTAETVTFEDMLTNPQAGLQFKTNRKGALRVSFKEIQ